jgi:pyruvate kinase
VLDGADAVMLSGETSVGHYPIEAVATMSRIVTAVEDGGLDALPQLKTQPTSKAGAIGEAATRVGEIVGARFLVAFTETGSSALAVGRHRSPIPLLAFTPKPRVRSQLSVAWGVETFLVPSVAHTDDMVRLVDQALLDLARCEKGDYVVIVAGSPPGIPGSTNAMRVHRIGDAVGEVAAAYRVAD